MRPTDPKHLRKKKTATAALKRKIKLDFGWLEGAPALEPGARISANQGIPWVLFWKDKRFAPHTVDISKAQLRAALRAPAEVKRSFPRAFPNLVGDVDAWIEQHRAVPALLAKATSVPDPLAEDFPIPERIRNTARAIADDHPALRPLLNRLLWRAVYDQKTVRRELTLVKKIAATLAGALPVIGASDLDVAHRDRRHAAGW